jgi:uncharacterized RDD family membrane protein YckC
MSAQEAMPVPVEAESAGFWVRGGAVAVDTIVLLVAAVPLAWTLIAAGIPRPLQSASGWLLGIGYYTWMIGFGGQTVGKMAAGVMVVRMDGSAVGYPRALGRYLASWVSAAMLTLGFIAAAFTGKKRALHDYIADTRVVFAEEVGTGRRALMTALAVCLLLSPLAIIYLEFKSPVVSAMFKRPGDDASVYDKVQTLKLKTKEVATKRGLGGLRSSLSSFYGDSEGTYPHDLNELIAPKAGAPVNTNARYPYLAAMTEVQTKDHPPTNAVEAYGNEVCIPGKDIAVDPAKLRDTGRWGYVADKASPCWGTVFVDCTHKDSKGVDWYSY